MTTLPLRDYASQNLDTHTLDSHDHPGHNSAHRTHSFATVASSQQDPHPHHHEGQETEAPHTHSHVHEQSDKSHSDSRSSPADEEQTQHVPKSSTIRERKPHSRGPSLQVTLGNNQTSSAPTVQVPFPVSSPVDSPLSHDHPSTFKHDHHPVHDHHDDVGRGHYAHSHGHDHDHHSHSHNMRGVFLHVMAVCFVLLSKDESQRY